MRYVLEERQIYSQQGEDGVIEDIFETIGTPKYGVEYEGMFLGHEDRGDTTMRVVTPDLRVL